MALTASTCGSSRRPTGASADLVERKQFRAGSVLSPERAWTSVCRPFGSGATDILELARYFLERHRGKTAAASVGRGRRRAASPTTGPATFASWSGSIERAVALASSDVIELEDLPAPLWRDLADIVLPSLERNETMRAWAARYARLMVARCGGRRSEAARTLGISYHTLKGHLKLPGGSGRLAGWRKGGATDRRRALRVVVRRASPVNTVDEMGQRLSGAVEVARAPSRRRKPLSRRASMFHLRGVRTLVQHRRASAVVFSIALFCAVWASTWRPTAQNQNLPRPNAVERLDAAAPARPLNPADRGATYRWLDERAVRVTTTFVDAVVVTERIPGGDLQTRIRDTAGRELGEFTVDRVGAGDDVLTFKRGGEQVVRAAGKPNGPLTLDWSNRQAYAIWKDDPANPATPLEWQGDVIRARGGRPLDFRRDTLEVRTEWLDGFAAKASRAAGRRPNPKTGAPSNGLTFESQLARDNVEVGRSRWYPEEQVYVWSVPGITTGYLDAERMKDTGGWTFTPDLAWANAADLRVSLLSHVDGDARIRRRRGACGEQAVAGAPRRHDRPDGARQRAWL